MAPSKRLISASAAIVFESSSDSSSEAYRNALQAFIDRRRNPNESGCIILPKSPDKERFDFFIKRNNENDDNKMRRNDKMEIKIGMSGIPHVEASDIFEIGWIAGTEDRYMELMFAEWQSTRVSLRRHTHPDCCSAVKADLEVLTEIRHPNVLLLMATTHTDEHGLVAIFEPVDCTLYNFVHEQGERVSVQGIAKCAGNLAGALKHAHMRGYVHGAISSHCVFLATCGTVKLGGWELAGSLNGPKIIREYEERLRLEIYRWQAPEIYSGQEPSKATDVYGLALLMWEMCTMNIPWNGLSKSEVERQYVQWERGIITDLYNLPPLLNKLLNAGLQLDISKRTLDMSRMRRFLQTLEIQYENAEPMYVETSINNKQNSPKLVLNVTPECELTRDSPPVKRYTSAPTPKRYSERKKIVESKGHPPPRSLNLNLVEESDKSESRDLSSLTRNKTASMEIFQQVFKTPSVQRVNARNVNKACPSEKLSSASKQRHSKIGESQKKIPRESPVAPNETRILDSADDESSFKDTRISIKKLRQTLASRREDFFYGSDSSQLSPAEDKTESMKSRILMQARNKDYEPHKPASHKTSFEPKQTTSPGQYNLTPPRLAIHKSQKSPYSYVPSAVRDAVVQPKVLNPDSQSFFESSLWRKEKMICISKMRKSDVDDSTFCIARYLPNSNETSAVEKAAAESAESNETYTIDPKNLATDAESNPTAVDPGTSTIPRSTSLQALKNSLERATEIVLSTTSSHEESPTIALSSPFKSSQNFDKNTSVEHEALFEDLYQLKHEGSDSEIKSIERTTEEQAVFFLPEDNSPDAKDEKREEIAESVVRRRNTSRDETKKGSFEPSRLSGVVCESIAESLTENDHSSSDSKPDDRTVILSSGYHLNPETAVPHHSASFELGKDEEENNENHESNFTLMVFSDKSRGCQSCSSMSNLVRRRSLPAALGQLRNLSNVSLGKLPIRKGDVSDSTVEDIYIDDEFGEYLNVNMVLLDEDDTSDGEDFLPDIEPAVSQECP